MTDDEWIINESDLTSIKCANYPWMSQCSVMNIELTFIYNGNGRQKTQSVILNNPGKEVTELLDFLKDRYREICFIGPTEKERAEILSPDYTGVYKMHSLHILTPLGVIAGILLIFIFVLYLMIATTDQTIMTNPGKMNRVGLVILMLSLVPSGIMYLIGKKLFMVVRTDRQNITVRKFLGRKRYRWDSVTEKTPKSEIHNVYKGLYYNNRGEKSVASDWTHLGMIVRMPSKTIKLVFFTLEEPPIFDTGKWEAGYLPKMPESAVKISF